MGGWVRLDAPKFYCGRFHSRGWAYPGDGNGPTVGTGHLLHRGYQQHRSQSDELHVAEPRDRRRTEPACNGPDLQWGYRDEFLVAAARGGLLSSQYPLQHSKLEYQNGGNRGRSNVACA